MTDLPRVSAILRAAGLAGDWSAIDPGVLELARLRGSAVHALIEGDVYGYGLEAPSSLEGYLQGWWRFLLESSFQVARSEFRVESARWGFCGHPDLDGWLLGCYGVIDIKTAAVLDRDAVARQLAAYRLLAEEERPERKVDFTSTLQLFPDGRYKLQDVETRGLAEEEFLAALVCYRARQRSCAGM